MGGGSRSDHQHHVVDSGLGASAPAVVLDAPRIGHLLPNSSAVQSLSYAYGADGTQHGTLEVQWRANGLTYQFADVPSELWDRLNETHTTGGSVGSLVATEVARQFPSRMVVDDEIGLAQQFDRQVSAGQTTVDVAAGNPQTQHCPGCGQFLGEDTHVCPVRASTWQRISTPTGAVHAPPARTLLQYSRTASAPLRVPVSASIGPEENAHESADEDPGGVEGSCLVFSPEDDIDLHRAAAHLQCDCGQPECQHVRTVALYVNTAVRRVANADAASALRQTLFTRQGGEPRPQVPYSVLAQSRCGTCGQFIGGTEHDCPVLAASMRHYVNDRGAMDIPNVSALQRALNLDGGHAAQVPLSATVQLPGDRNEFLVRGTAAVHAADHGFDPAAATADLTCTCGESGCRHAHYAAADLSDRVHSPRIRTPERRATTAVLQELSAEHTQSVTAHQESQLRDDQSVSYSDDPGAFDTAYRGARQRLDEGGAAVPYLTENATGGLGAREGGRAFGVELEFDLPDNINRDTTLHAIAQDMYRAGITRHPYLDRWHASARDGYTDARNAWRLERDSTVAGEVVSPILYDTPQTWQDLQTVCDIVRRHGGTASVRAGGHVHVSAGNYDHTVGNHNRLLGLVESHQDSLFRIATNPERGEHRGTRWCTPNSTPTTGYRDIRDARTDNNSHGLAVNLQSMHGQRSDHVEFRMWDASLEPAVIQSQIKVSLGMTEAAFRDDSAGATPRTSERVGTARRRWGTTDPAGPHLHESTRGFRRLLDTIFHRDADKAQLTSLFAITRWQRS